MKKYFADTNFYLRFLLQDNQAQADQVEKELKKAKDGKQKIIFLSAIILETAFVLKSNYSVTSPGIAEYLSVLVATPYLDIEDRNIWIKILPFFAQSKIDLIDIFLFEKAKDINAQVLSFDKDFKKLKQKPI